MPPPAPRQVLKLEMDLEEQQGARGEQQERLQRLTAERDQVRPAEARGGALLHWANPTCEPLNSSSLPRC